MKADILFCNNTKLFTSDLLRKEYMKRRTPLFTVLTIGIILIALFSCSDEGNPKEKARQSLGEPEEIQYEEFAGYQIERWVYPRTDWNIIYEFQKSSASCGGSSEWYISRQYYASWWGYDLYDPPPVIEHEPVTSAPPGKQIYINTTVTVNPKAVQDTQVQEVKLFYRAAGDSLFESMIMAPQDSMYTGDIPAHFVNEKGVEYRIAATSDISIWDKYSFMPAHQDSVFRIEIPGAGAGEVTTLGETLITIPKVAVPVQLEPGMLSGRSSPVGP